MATYYYNSNATGAGGDNNLSNSLNWWQDSAWTVPAGQIPLYTDDVVIGGYAGTGTLNCNDLSFGSNGCIDNSATVFIYGTATYNGFSGYLSSALVYFLGGQFTSLSPTGLGIWNDFFYRNGVLGSGGWVGVYYTDGSPDSSYNGWGTDYYHGAPYLYIHGSWVGYGPCGYNGTLYYDGQQNYVDSTDTGFYPDYGLDPSGSTQYLFYQGALANGGFDNADEGKYYTNGLVDTTFTGVANTFFLGDMVYWGNYGYYQGDGLDHQVLQGQLWYIGALSDSGVYYSYDTNSDVAVRNGVVATDVTGYYLPTSQWFYNGEYVSSAPAGQLDSNGNGFPTTYYLIDDPYGPYTNVLFINGSPACTGPDYNVGYSGVLYGACYNGSVSETGFYPDYYYDSTGVTQYYFAGGSIYYDCGGSFVTPDISYTDPNGAVCSTYNQDPLGYCCGNAEQDCAGNWYSVSENSYVYDNGTYCSPSSTDALGHCCGTCNDSSAVNEDGSGCIYSDGYGYTCHSYEFANDPAGHSCCSNSLDPLGYCGGDGYSLDCYSNFYSPSNENGYTFTDPNGVQCYYYSQDYFGYCCGNCNDSSACSEDVNGCVYDYGFGCGIPLPSDLYFTNAASNNDWTNINNWNTSPDGSGFYPNYVPWTDNGSGGVWYSNTNLLDVGNGFETNIPSYISIPSGVTAMCDLIVINYGTIYSGTFTGNHFYNYNLVNGIVFSGTYFDNAQGAQAINSTFNTDGFNDYSVVGCYFKSTGVFPYNGKNYSFQNDFVAIEYPYSSGGTPRFNVGPLIGLPPFIQL